MKTTLHYFALILTLATILMITGCASVETVKNSQGQGETRTYGFGYEKVFNATLDAAKAKELKVVESSQGDGKVILSHGVTWWSWGERIALFITSIDSETTKVEIVSKPVLAPLNYPPDWQAILLEQIHLELIGE